MESRKYSLNETDVEKIVSAIFWSGLSASLGALILVIPDIDVPAAYVILVPVLNTILYTLKRFVDGKLE